MSKSSITKGRLALTLSPMILVAVAFFASIPWMKNLADPAVWAITVAAAVFVVGYALFISARLEPETLLRR